MISLTTDLSCALEETKVRRSRHWKHRIRSRSASNLFAPGGPAGGPKTDSDETSKDVNDSDDAERSFAKLTIQNKAGSKYLQHQKLPMQSVVESDSFNELFGGCSQPRASQTKRRRRYKRMAVDVTDLSNVNISGTESISGMSAIAAVVPKASDINYLTKKLKKKTCITEPQGTIDFGKRKRNDRNHRDRPVEGHSVVENAGVHLEAVNSSTATDLNHDEMDEDMKSEDDDDDDDDSSNVFSSTESESTEETSEGQEGDDEHSDYCGEDWIDESVDSVERRRDLIMRRLKDYAPNREIRAGRRRVHPNKPVFSFRTSANEQLSKFLQDPEQSQLKLHPMRRSERIQLGHIATLYSLQMHYHHEDEGSEKGFTCPILTKTSNTAQMDTKSADEGEKTSWLGPLWTESDSKRIKNLVCDDSVSSSSRTQ